MQAEVAAVSSAYNEEKAAHTTAAKSSALHDSAAVANKANLFGQISGLSGLGQGGAKPAAGGAGGLRGLGGLGAEGLFGGVKLRKTTTVEKSMFRKDEGKTGKWKVYKFISL